MTAAKELSAKLREIWGDEKKRVNLLIAAGLAGLLLICVSEWIPETKDSAPVQTAVSGNYEQQLEERLTGLISAMDGAGRAKVMVTLEAEEETVYAQDTESSRDSGGETSRSTHVLTGGSAGLVETVLQPEVRGVAVLCEGGDQPGVQRRVTELVSALTGVGANHITVNKLQS